MEAVGIGRRESDLVSPSRNIDVNVPNAAISQEDFETVCTRGGKSYGPEVRGRIMLAVELAD